MPGHTCNVEFMRLAADHLEAEKFKLLDIGCSGGIDPVWRAFEPRLQAIGIDASETECRRLIKEELNPNISYVAAFVSGWADKPIDLSVDSASSLSVRMCNRLSVARMLELRRARLQRASDEEKLSQNLWQLTGLADPQKPIVAPDFLAERGWTDLDYLKIDIDGADFEVLQSFKAYFNALGIIAVQLEVNFHGTDQPHEHTFHNTDRFMRAQGFDLFRLDNRTYSTRALPARFAITTPAQTVSGRVFQGDAYYARDPIAMNNKLNSLTAKQLIKLAAIFSAWGLPDSSAEILLKFRKQMESMIDVDQALDTLAAQIQSGEDEVLPYRDYMTEFAKEAPRFFPPPNTEIGQPTFWQRIRAARAAYWDWCYAHNVANARMKGPRR